jgi:hypothetical protein
VRPEAIRHDWPIDELREAGKVSVWDNAAGYMEAVKRSYLRDNWPDQPNYCEVWCEKATVLELLRPVTQDYGVMLRVCRGFGSAAYEVNREFVRGDFEADHDLLPGDHDPSGHDIERDIHRRAQLASGKEFRMNPPGDCSQRHQDFPAAAAEGKGQGSAGQGLQAEIRERSSDGGVGRIARRGIASACEQGYRRTYRFRIAKRLCRKSN